MCFAPDIPEVKNTEAAKAPVFNSTATTQGRSGRKGTLLTPTAPSQPMMTASAPTAKKTLLGS